MSWEFWFQAWSPGSRCLWRSVETRHISTPVDPVSGLSWQNHTVHLLLQAGTGTGKKAAVGLGWRGESGLWNGGAERQASPSLHCLGRAGDGLSDDFLNLPGNLQQRSFHRHTKRKQRALPKESLPKWSKSLSAKCYSLTKHMNKKHWRGEKKEGCSYVIWLSR